MSELSYENLLKAYSEVKHEPNILRYSIDENGVVNFFGENDEWVGMTSQKGLQYLLDNQPS